MKESIEKITKQIAEDQATMNTVSWQAQEVILNPDIPEADKDEVVEAAVETILRIGQNRTTYNAIIDAHNAKQELYNANQREKRRLKRSQTIYEAK
jgi:hypothetical protein